MLSITALTMAGCASRTAKSAIRTPTDFTRPKPHFKSVSSAYTPTFLTASKRLYTSETQPKRYEATARGTKKDKFRRACQSGSGMNVTKELLHLMSSHAIKPYHFYDAAAFSFKTHNVHIAARVWDAMKQHNVPYKPKAIVDLVSTFSSYFRTDLAREALDHIADKSSSTYMRCMIHLLTAEANASELIEFTRSIPDDQLTVKSLAIQSLFRIHRLSANPSSETTRPSGDKQQLQLSGPTVGPTEILAFANGELARLNIPMAAKMAAYTIGKSQNLKEAMETLSRISGELKVPITAHIIDSVIRGIVESQYDAGMAIVKWATEKRGVEMNAIVFHTLLYAAASTNPLNVSTTSLPQRIMLSMCLHLREIETTRETKSLLEMQKLLPSYRQLAHFILLIKPHLPKGYSDPILDQFDQPLAKRVHFARLKPFTNSFASLIPLIFPSPDSQPHHLLSSIKDPLMTTS